MAQLTLDRKETLPTHGGYDNDFKGVKNADDFATVSVEDDDPNRLPTDEERATLRLVSAPVPWAAYAIAIVEFGVCPQRLGEHYRILT
ncbi:hypothetical protein H0H87_010376 [Tephrocybe sp. NHM501043]|nr:hypothetical protein H0H87_010376 [Tephrocybe sp. NHM501043]